MNGRHRRITRRERIAAGILRTRSIRRLRGDGKPALGREAPRAWQLRRSRQVLSVITIHRRIERDLTAQLHRLRTRRYCWAPLRWQIAMME